MECPTMLKRTTLRAACAAALIALTACASVPQPVSVTDTIARTPALSTLSRLITEAGLADTLRGTGPYTVFAPSDDAFKALPAGALAKLAADKDALRAVLTFHVLPAKVLAAGVNTGNAKTVNGAPLALAKAGTFVTVEEALVQSADLVASNGVVHVVDRVLMPPKR
jgi:uncharacterized surface protein with fasciclin (FAS1) repeats